MQSIYYKQKWFILKHRIENKIHCGKYRAKSTLLNIIIIYFYFHSAFLMFLQLSYLFSALLRSYTHTHTHFQLHIKTKKGSGGHC